MRILLCLLLCGIIEDQASAARLQPSNFRQYAAVDGALKAGTLYRIDLPADVLRGCAPGQPDIRLFAPDGAEVPYTLVKGEYLKKADESYSAEITGYQAGPKEAVLEFKFTGQLNPLTSVELSVTDSDFRKEAALYGSEDGKAWSHVGTWAIYDYSSQVALRRTRLDFNASTRRFYRLKLRDTEDPQPLGKTVTFKYDGIDLSVSGGKGKKLHINGVVGRTGGQDALVGVYDEESFQPSAGELKDNSSYVAINGGLPFEKVGFSVDDPFFVREFTAWYSETGGDETYKRLGAGNIYRFPSGWSNGERVWADIASPGYAYYKFIFVNRNNPPLRVRAVRLKWLRRSLHFIAPADMTGLTLAFGRPNTVRPAYDMENFINQGNWEKRSPEQLRLKAPALTEGYSPDAPADRKGKLEKNLLTGIIMLVVAGMGFWLYKLLKKAALK